MTRDEWELVFWGMVSLSCLTYLLTELLAHG
jgi:hypothetical protein